MRTSYRTSHGDLLVVKLDADRSCRFFFPPTVATGAQASETAVAESQSERAPVAESVESARPLDEDDVEAPKTDGFVNAQAPKSDGTEDAQAVGTRAGASEAASTEQVTAEESDEKISQLPEVPTAEPVDDAQPVLKKLKLNGSDGVA